MIRLLTTAAITTMAGLLSLGLTCAPAYGQDQPPPRRADRGKEAIEFPIKNIVAGANTPTPAASADNPAVAPGKVRWHASIEAACQAAQKSGKPVLLFQMLGKLDQQFC